MHPCCARRVMCASTQLSPSQTSRATRTPWIKPGPTLLGAHRVPPPPCDCRLFCAPIHTLPLSFHSALVPTCCWKRSAGRCIDLGRAALESASGMLQTSLPLIACTASTSVGLLSQRATASRVLSHPSLMDCNQNLPGVDIAIARDSSTALWP